MSLAGDVSQEVFEPQTWSDLLTAHTAKGDLFSVKTLTIILEGVEQLAAARQDPACPFVVTGFHVSLFERLRGAFNNATLLKAIGMMYLGEFRMPAVALQHFAMARQLAPTDRDLDQLEKTAALAVAKLSSNAPMDEAFPPKPEVKNLIHSTTTRLHRVETRERLTGSTSPAEPAAKRKPGAATVALQNFDRAFAQVRQAIKEVKFGDAFATLAEVTKASAPLDEVQVCYAELGLAAFDHGRLADALGAYLKMRELEPKSVDGWFNCGLVYQRMGMSDEALDCYEEASRIDPKNATTWCNLSSIWFERGDYEEAERVARKALELRPDYPRALDNLGAALSALDRLPEAAEVCQRAIRLQPNLHSAWFKLGVIKFQQDDFLASMEAFNLTGENPDFFPFVLFYLCMIDARRGKLDDALQKLASARAADPDNQLEPLALKEIGALCTKLGRHTTAAEFYGRITELTPDDITAWLAKGTAHHRVSQFEEARGAYEHVTQLQPENAIAWHNLGLLATDLGQHQEACDYFQREVELAPEDAKAWYDLATSWQTLGNAEESARAFEQAETLVRQNSRKTSDLSAAMSIVRRLNMGDRVLKTGELG